MQINKNQKIDNFDQNSKFRGRVIPILEILIICLFTLMALCWSFHFNLLSITIPRHLVMLSQAQFQTCSQKELPKKVCSIKWASKWASIADTCLWKHVHSAYLSRGWREQTYEFFVYNIRNLCFCTISVDNGGVDDRNSGSFWGTGPSFKTGGFWEACLPPPPPPTDNWKKSEFAFSPHAWRHAT